MKKSIQLFVSMLFVGFIFVSCTSSDDDASTEAAIEGKWNFNKISYASGGITTPEVESDENEVGCNKDYIQISAGGVITNGDYSGSTCDLEILSGTWTRNGNNLTVALADESFDGTFEIIKLTATELKIKITGIDNGISISVIQSFTRA